MLQNPRWQPGMSTSRVHVTVSTCSLFAGKRRNAGVDMNTAPSFMHLWQPEALSGLAKQVD